MTKIETKLKSKNISQFKILINIIFWFDLNLLVFHISGIFISNNSYIILFPPVNVQYNGLYCTVFPFLDLMFVFIRKLKVYKTSI